MHQKHDSQSARSPISAVESFSYGREILERFLDILESALAIGKKILEPLTLILAPLIDLIVFMSQL